MLRKRFVKRSLAVTSFHLTWQTRSLYGSVLKPGLSHWFKASFLSSAPVKSRITLKRVLENTFCVGNLILGIYTKSSFYLSLLFKRRGSSHTGKYSYRDTKQLCDYSPHSCKAGNHLVPHLLFLLSCVFILSTFSITLLSSLLSYHCLTSGFPKLSQR